MAVRYEDVLELAKQLKPEEQIALIEYLRARQTGQVTRAMLLAEFERRKAAGETAKDQLYFGIFADPPVDLSEEELEASIREASTEWEKELDEFFGDED